MKRVVPIKSAAELAMSRTAGLLAADVLAMIGEYVQPGVTTEELDRRCHDYIVNVQGTIQPMLVTTAFRRPCAFPSTRSSATAFRRRSAC